MFEVFQECTKLGRIFTLGRTGLISLIPKKMRDLRWIRNWRPIILLCADYKILVKVIANRTKTQLEQIINYDQSAFLKGRNISNSIRKVIDTVRYCDQKQINALLISLDFEKAFDRVEYQSLYKALKLFNFGEKMISFTKMLFTDFSLCTTNNGYLSSFFQPTRGLFQGNPYSCYVFLVIIELLALKLRTNSDIKGVKIGQMVNLLSLFTDDLNIFIESKV